MQRALRPDSTRHDPGSATTRANRFPVAGVAVAVAGAGLIAVIPGAPSPRDIQHNAVQLTAGAADILGDWQEVLTAADTNLQTLASGADAANSELLQALSTNLSGYSDLVGTALTGTETGLQNALYGGWWGDDDGYVFGLLGGSVTDPITGVTESGSTLQEISTALQSGNVFNAFGYFDEWSLETLDHTLHPLLGPILSTSAGAPTIQSDLLQTLTNVVETFSNYDVVRLDLVQGLISPEISVAFGFANILNEIGTDVSSGNIDGALTVLSNAPSDLVGDLLNGYVDTAFDPTNTTPDTALLNSGSLLDDLLVQWPTLLATALSESTAPESTAAAVAVLPDLAAFFDPATLVTNLTGGLLSF